MRDTRAGRQQFGSKWPIPLTSVVYSIIHLFITRPTW